MTAEQPAYEDEQDRLAYKPPYLQAILEPVGTGMRAWAQVVGGRWDGHSTFVYYTEIKPESEMCARVTADLAAKMKRLCNLDLAWDDEIRFSERRE